METGFIYSAMQGADIATIGEFTLIHRHGEKQIAAFKGGKCVETFETRADAKAFARKESE